MKKIKGIVVSGKMRGRLLGFPTANVPFEENIKKGIYAGKAYYKGKKYKSAVYIGENSHIAEVYIFDFNEDIYGEKITVELGKKIRNPQKFNSDADLKAQIVTDLVKIKNM